MLYVTYIVSISGGGGFRLITLEADVSIDGTWRGPTQGQPSSGIVNLRLQRHGKQLRGKMVISNFHSGEMTAQLSGELGDDNRFEAVLESFEVTNLPASVPRTGSLAGNYDPHTPLILGKWRTDTGAYGILFLVPDLHLDGFSPPD